MLMLEDDQDVIDKINNILDEIADCRDIQFPYSFQYCKGLGEPTFTFTVDKQTLNYFFDVNGQKWTKSE